MRVGSLPTPRRQIIYNFLSSHSAALIRFVFHFSCQSSPPYNRGDHVCLVYHCLCTLIQNRHSFNMHLKTNWSFQLHSSPRGPGLTQSLVTEVATPDRTIRSRYKYFNYLSAFKIKNLHWNLSQWGLTHSVQLHKEVSKTTTWKLSLSEVHWPCYSKSAIHSKIFNEATIVCAML